MILTRDGQPFVSVRDVNGSDWESTSLAHDPKFAALIRKSRDSHQEEGGIGMEALRRELGLETDQPGAGPDA